MNWNVYSVTQGKKKKKEWIFAVSQGAPQGTAFVEEEGRAPQQDTEWPRPAALPSCSVDSCSDGNFCSFSKSTQPWTVLPRVLYENGTQIIFWGKPPPSPWVSPFMPIGAHLSRQAAFCSGTYPARLNGFDRAVPNLLSLEGSWSTWSHPEWKHSKNFPRSHLKPLLLNSSK